MAYESSSHRNRDLKTVHYLYDWIEPYGQDTCVYCGDLAFTRDHVTPVWYVADLLHLEGDIERHRPRLRHGLVVVPACHDCNSRLGRFIAFSITQKRAELKRRLRSRWRRLLESYDWQEDDLDAMGRTLRGHIQVMEDKRMAVLRRLAFPSPGEASLLRAAADAWR